MSPAESRYPVVEGKIRAPSLELGIAESCNLTCRSCSHLSPILPRRFMEATSVRRDLEALGRHYHARSVRLMGGEPLLHTGIVELAAAIRATGIADSITVVTNGVLLPRMEPDFWSSVDTVEVSLYPGKELSAAQQRACRQSADAHGVSLNFKAWKEFRHSFSEPGTADKALVRAIYDTCLVVHDWRNHTVANGRFFKCPQSHYLPQALEACAENEQADSIAIDDSERFGAELLAYLDSPEPLLSCGNCLGTAGKRFPHTQVARAEFRSLQQLPAEELVDPALLRPRRSRSPRRWRALRRRVAAHLRTRL